MLNRRLIAALMVTSLFALPMLAVDEGTPAPAAPPASSAKPLDAEGDGDLRKMKDELGRLQVEAQLRQARLQAELAPQQEKAARDQAKKQADGSPNQSTTEELARLQAESQIRQLKLQAELAPLQEEIQRLKMRLDAEQSRRQAERSARLAASEQADFELQLKLAEQERANRQAKAEVERLSGELALAEARFKAENVAKNLEVARQKQAVGLEQARRELDNVVVAPLVYADEPFKDGVLTITDRRVSFNGPVTGQSVQVAIDQINFFANQSTKPIFLVIDSSPGGSVAAGMMLIEAMKSSRAPVHVVVKVFAASMAATICTMAEHSYAAPNAIILHHQLSYGAGGGSGQNPNLTQHRETLKQSEEWYRRIGEPVAKKMGLTLEQFVAEMYKHNSDGDWMEFADQAQKNKWVQQIATEIKELAVRQDPNTPVNIGAGGPVRPAGNGCEARKDDQGHEYILLPRLESYDCWNIHNPDNYYRPQ